MLLYDLFEDNWKWRMVLSFVFFLSSSIKNGNFIKTVCFGSKLLFKIRILSNTVIQWTLLASPNDLHSTLSKFRRQRINKENRKMAPHNNNIIQYY